MKVAVALKAKLLLSLPFRPAGNVNVGLASKALSKTPPFRDVRSAWSSSCCLFFLQAF